MKLLFSVGLLLVLYLIPVQAKEVILFSYHPSQVGVTKLLKKIMHENMEFPDELVEFIESENPCEKKEVAAAHICIDSSGEMDFPIIYTEVMRETLGIYWEDVANELKNK